MRLCVLIASYERSESPFSGLDPYPDPSLWVPEHQWSTAYIHKATAVRQVRALCKQPIDVFVNLCDATWEEDRAGVDVAIELERQGRAYTGATPRFFEPTRKALKLICPDVGVQTPRYLFAQDLEAARLADAHLRYPMIVKHPNSYGSIGLTRDSRVGTLEELCGQVSRMVEEFGGALIEEFIEGREFTTLVAEDPSAPGGVRGYTPVEILFPHGESFKHFDLKFRTYGDMAARPVQDQELTTRLNEAAALAFEGLKGAGYARCDLRLGRDGQLYLLDINPNPGVFYPPDQPGSADLILRHSPGGHRAFLETILAAALAGQARRRPKWAIRHHPETGYGLVAAVEIAEGERVFVKEERPHQLVSRQHVARSWPTWRRKVFEQCAYPVSDELYVMWSDNPEEWFPTNHSCDPSVVLDGLDFVARRPIHVGEPITLDYATFAGPGLGTFECRCGSPSCRRIVRSTDYLAPWLEERYGAFIHDWVKMARRREQAGGVASRARGEDG